VRNYMYLVPVIVACVAMAVTAAAADDWEYWNRELLRVSIDDTQVEFETGFRFRDDMTDYYYQHNDFSMKYRGKIPYDTWISLRIARFEAGNEWKLELRPYAAVTPRFVILGLPFANRMRLEYLSLEDRDNSLRYRNQTSLTIPWQLGRGATASAYYEWFFAINDAEMTQWRIGAVLKIRMLSWLTLEGNYIRRGTKGAADWTRANILVTRLRARF